MTNGQQFFLNDFEIIKLGSTTPEYQYNLKDHLGNVRVTFTTKYEAPQYTATLENATQTQEQSTFEGYSRVTNDLFDHTDAGTVYDKTQLLNGGVSGQVGLAKSFTVVPGDTLVAEVYAKYFGTEGGPSNLTGFAAALTGAFGLSGATGGEQLLAYNALNNYGGLVAAGTAHGYDPGWPKGYLTILIFNKDYVLVDAAWQQLDVVYVQTGATKMPHGLLSRQVVIKEPGYAYIYLSNEGAVQQDIYFDDVTITHKKSPIVQSDEYYPFGLSISGLSYQRENSVPQNMKYNGFENEDELGLNVNSSVFRMHDPAIGRWWQIDTKPNEMTSPYAAMSNNPILYADPLGDTVIINTRTDYSLTNNPTRQSDLGQTNDTRHAVTGATQTDVTIEVDVAISYSGAFQGATPETNVESQNPGLFTEVQAHEEGHKAQITEGANLPISLDVPIDGNTTTFSGRPDKVILNAASAFTGSTQANGMSTADAQTFVTNNIINPALAMMSNNIDAVARTANTHDDANSRASTSLGRPLIYNNQNVPRYQGRPLRRD